MALTFSVAKVENHRELTSIYRDVNHNAYLPSEVSKDDEGEFVMVGEKRIDVYCAWHPLTEAIVHAMMVCDIGELTDEVLVDEFYVRTRIYDRLFEPMFLKPDRKGYSFTREEVRSHMGITTNVITRKFSHWSTRMLASARRDIERG